MELDIIVAVKAHEHLMIARDSINGMPHNFSYRVIHGPEDIATSADAAIVHTGLRGGKHPSINDVPYVNAMSDSFGRSYSASSHFGQTPEAEVLSHVTRPEFWRGAVEYLLALASPEAFRNYRVESEAFSSKAFSSESLTERAEGQCFMDEINRLLPHLQRQQEQLRHQLAEVDKIITTYSDPLSPIVQQQARWQAALNGLRRA